MRITKYIHSCLLVEEAGEKLLFDPGIFTFGDGQVDPALFHDVTTILITHGHPDHLDIAALRQIVQQSHATIITNAATQAKLDQEGIAATVLASGSHQTKAFTITAYPAAHAPILGSQPPENTAYLINGAFLNPGDAFDPHLATLKGVTTLALAVAAPWNTELMVADFARMLAPGHVIPVHDGYIKPFFLKQRYDNYTAHFQQQGITFHRLAQPGESAEVPGR